MPYDVLLTRKDFVSKHKSPIKPPPATLSADIARQKRARESRKFSVRIRYAALGRYLISILYKKVSTNRIENYLLEPYSYRTKYTRLGRRKMLFAFDRDGDSIKGFIVANIRKVDITSERFVPKWDVEF